MEEILGIATSILSGVSVAALLAVTKHFNSVIKDFRKRNHDFHNEFNELKESQRNQIKAQIVQLYSTCVARGHITFMELETVNRLADSYFKLGGNNYIHALMDKLNDMPVKGEHLPTT